MQLMIFNEENHRMLSKNFSSKEFACPCCGYAIVDVELIIFLENLRRCIGKKIKINSGYRCPKQNAIDGGATYSRHLIGCAADITWGAFKTDMHPDSRLHKEYGFPKLTSKNWKALRGLGIGKNFIHVDVDENRGQTLTEWKY